MKPDISLYVGKKMKTGLEMWGGYPGEQYYLFSPSIKTNEAHEKFTYNTHVHP